MVNTTRILGKYKPINTGDLMAYLNELQSCKYLGVSRGFLFKQVAYKYLEAKVEEIGNEKTGVIRKLRFKPEELERFKILLKKGWKPGQRLI